MSLGISDLIETLYFINSLKKIIIFCYKILICYLISFYYELLFPNTFYIVYSQSQSNKKNYNSSLKNML